MASTPSASQLSASLQRPARHETAVSLRALGSVCRCWSHPSSKTAPPLSSVTHHHPNFFLPVSLVTPPISFLAHLPWWGHLNIGNSRVQGPLLILLSLPKWLTHAHSFNYHLDADTTQIPLSDPLLLLIHSAGDWNVPTQMSRGTSNLTSKTELGTLFRRLVFFACCLVPGATPRLTLAYTSSTKWPADRFLESPTTHSPNHN